MVRHKSVSSITVLVVATPTGLCIRLFVLALLSGLFFFTSPRALAEESSAKPWAIYGDAVTADGVKSGWLIFERGKITAVGAPDTAVPEDARRIRYDGYIFPGLIDTHNHVSWNAIPKWSGGTFTSRYEWQADPGYIEQVNWPFYSVIVERRVESEATKYGEIRALIGGTTMIQSTYTDKQPKLLIKNLDSGYQAQAYTGNIRTLKAYNQGTLYNNFVGKLGTPDLKRVFLHIGEGKSSNAYAREEFSILSDLQLLKPGLVVIHGMALGPSDFATMKKQGMYLVWSPRSNWNLYHDTTDVVSAIQAGVTVALAPDWTISGSDNLLEEMKFARATMIGSKLSSQDLFRMCTSDAALVAGVENKMGRLASDYDADLFLAPHLAENIAEPTSGARVDPGVKLKLKPYDSLLRTYPKDIHLVFVDGQPIYGDASEMQKWTVGYDYLLVDGRKKAVITTGDGVSTEHFDNIQKALTENMARVAPLLEN